MIIESGIHFSKFALVSMAMEQEIWIKSVFLKTHPSSTFIKIAI